MSLYHRPTVYLPGSLSDEIRAEAKRIGKPVSWIVRHAWDLARKEIQAMKPNPPETPAAPSCPRCCAALITNPDQPESLVCPVFSCRNAPHTNERG